MAQASRSENLGEELGGANAVSSLPSNSSIREFLLGHAPNGSPRIDPDVGAPQADVFYHYKAALLQAIALDRATREEERRARRERRAISPEEIERLTEKHLARIPYKSTSCRYHSFVVYFSNLQRLGWVEFTNRPLLNFRNSGLPR
jgi:hypothetical protein